MRMMESTNLHALVEKHKDSEAGTCLFNVEKFTGDDGSLRYL